MAERLRLRSIPARVCCTAETSRRTGWGCAGGAYAGSAEKLFNRYKRLPERVSFGQGRSGTAPNLACRRESSPSGNIGQQHQKAALVCGTFRQVRFCGSCRLVKPPPSPRPGANTGPAPRALPGVHEQVFQRRPPEDRGAIRGHRAQAAPESRPPLDCTATIRSPALSSPSMLVPKRKLTPAAQGLA